MHHIECCNCSHGCGCQFSGFPDSESGGCEALLGFFVIEGHLDAIDLAGVKMVFAAMWPQAIHQGNGKGALFIDSSASEQQVTALATIMSGQAGGMPVEALATTFSEFEGPILKSITMEVDDKNSFFAIKDIVTVQQTPLINPMTNQPHNVHITYPDGGFFWNDGIVGTTSKMSLKYGDLSFEHTGQFAAKAIVDWSN
ncbi:MAG: DUF1326 domain-containing protein [Colwellia sp.]|nr:DUF1326 domain-containing protein [Colwellia sp.]